MTFLPLNHLHVQHNYAGAQWQDFTGYLTAISVNLREFSGANTGSLAFYYATMDPSQSSGTRVIKKGDRVRIRMENGSGVVRKTAKMKVKRVQVDIDLTKPVGRQNRVTVHLVGTGVAGVAGVGSSSGVATPEELSNTITGAPYLINGNDFVFTHNYAWTGTAHASTSTDTPLDADDIRTNLITNPSFETNATSWSGTGSATVAQSGTRAWTGTKSLLVTWPTTTAGAAHADITPGGLVVGDTYVLSGYVYVPTGSPDVALAAPGPAVTGASTSVKNTWTRISLTFVATSATNVLRLTTASASTSGQTAYLDGVLLEHTDTLEDYFDGDTADTGTTGISTPTDGVLTRTNLCTNPSFETNTTGWTAVSGSTISRTTSQQFSGSASLQVSRSATTGGATYTVTGLTSGQVYTVSAYAFHAGATTSFAITAGTAGTSVTPNGTWLRATKTFTASGTSQVITFGFTNSVAIILGEVDAVLIEHAGSASTYFDGATTDTDMLLYSWTGTANASTSTEAKTFTEITDNDTATDMDQIVLTRDSNPGVYALEDPEGTVQIFDSASFHTASSTLTVTANDYSSIDVAFDMSHIVNVLDVRQIFKIKKGKKGSKKVAVGLGFEDAPSIAKYGRFKKVHTVHGNASFDPSTYAAAVFAKNADPQEVPTSVTIGMRTASDLLAGYEDGVFVGHKVDVVLPDGVTTYTCRIRRIVHQITPTKWLVQLFLRDQHVTQIARESSLDTDVANNPDGTVYGEHLADVVDGTGKTISSATWVNNPDVGLGNQGIVIEDDGVGGIIKFFTGAAGETAPSTINPDAAGGMPSLTITGPRTGSGVSGPAAIAFAPGVLSLGSPGVVNLPNGAHFQDDVQMDDALNVDGNLAGGKVFTNTTDTSTNAVNAVILGGGQIVPHSSLSANKLEQEPLDLETARGLLNVSPRTWVDRFAAEIFGGTEGMRRTAGLIAEDVEEYAEDFAVYDAEGRLKDVDSQGVVAALLVIVADQERRIKALEDR